MGRHLRNDLRLGALRRAFIENAGRGEVICLAPDDAALAEAGDDAHDLRQAPRPANQNKKSAEARTIG